jgi:site-specific DNA-cytosine methylase
MRILIACEYSGRVRDAFIAAGHDAISCDLLPTDVPGPHYQGDVRDILYEEWGIVIAHPPCTDLSASGARHFAAKKADGRQQKSIEFFMQFTKLNCMWVIENPVGIMSTHYRKPDQIIQPWQFGHGETKATCLWLHGLPLLRPTNIVDGREQKIWKMSSSKNRGKLRSLTYQGIADAMGSQWAI